MTFDKNIQFTVGSTCLVVDSSDTFDNRKSHVCTATKPSATTIKFTITSCTSCPFVPGRILVYHYGNDAPVINSNDLKFKIATYLSGNFIVDSTPTNQGFASFLTYDNTLTDQLTVQVASSVLFASTKENTRTTMRIGFGPNQRGVYSGE